MIRTAWPTHRSCVSVASHSLRFQPVHGTQQQRRIRPLISLPPIILTSLSWLLNVSVCFIAISCSWSSSCNLGVSAAGCASVWSTDYPHTVSEYPTDGIRVDVELCLRREVFSKAVLPRDGLCISKIISTPTPHVHSGESKTMNKRYVDRGFRVPHQIRHFEG